MTEEQAKKLIKKAGGKWKTFIKWMNHQTVGVYEDGSTDWFEYDVNRFVRYKCDSKNEPIEEWD